MDGRMRAGMTATLAIVTAAAVTPGVSAQAPSPAPGLLGATTEVFRDDLSGPSVWEEISDDTGITVHEDGRLAMSVIADGSTVWDDHELEAPVDVLRVEALVATTCDGMAGVACGSSLGVPRFLWAGTDGESGWLVGRLIDGRLQLIDRGDLPRGVDGGRVTLAIECASSPADGGDHAVVTADGVPVATLFDIPVGPYDKATLLVGADAAPEEALFDDVVVHTGTTYIAPVGDLLASPTPQGDG